MKQRFTYEVVRELGHLGISDRNMWDRLVRLVSWNNRAPKVDIRQWAPTGGRMGRGISLNRDECAVLEPLLRSAWEADPPVEPLEPPRKYRAAPHPSRESVQ